MSEDWTIAKVERLAADSESESAVLEFKGAASLSLGDEHNKSELAKDVSSMANASGGTIIYGITQKPGRHGAPTADSLDPVPEGVCSAESIENVLTSRIQPAIPGVRIVHLPVIGGGLWVIEVPEGETAHQVLKSGVYYYRWNFKAEPTPDSMVRQVMSRGNRPKLEVAVTEKAGRDCLILEFAVTNSGTAVTRGWALEVCRTDDDDLFQIQHVGHQANDMRLEYRPDIESAMSVVDQTMCVTVQLESSLFPGQSRDLSRAFRVVFTERPGISVLDVEERSLHWAVYCDRRPVHRGAWDPEVFLEGVRSLGFRTSDRQ